MKRASHIHPAGQWPQATAIGIVTLPYGDRHRRRLRMTTDKGESFLLDLDRATLLHEGDGLRLDDGSWIQVSAAPEDVVDVSGGTAQATARLAWHLGNRHLPVQILDSGAIRFQYDHVIEAMVRGLGGTTTRSMAPFSPESGAYDSGGHGHQHSHDHGDGTAHE
jgi:urease accessory protein